MTFFRPFFCLKINNKFSYCMNSCDGHSCRLWTPLPTFSSPWLYAPQVKTVYTDVLSPFPKEIAQLEEQSVVFESTLLAVSPYKTTKQNTVVKLASSKVQYGVCTEPVAFLYPTLGFVGNSARFSVMLRNLPAFPLFPRRHRGGNPKPARKTIDCSEGII